MGRHRIDDLGIELLGERVELRAPSPRLLEVAGRQHDLDVRGEQTRAPDPVGGAVEDAPHGGGRGVHASLGRAKKGEAGLRLPAAAACAFVGLFGFGESPEKAIQLPC
jgi:hypothetical protein